MPKEDGSLRAIGNYLATFKDLIQLVWRVNPLLLLALLGLTVLNGLVPMATIFITAALLELLVQAVHGPAAGSALPPLFPLLLVLVAVTAVLGEFLNRLNATIQGLFELRVANHIKLLVVEKATSIDLAYFERPEFHNQMRVAISEAPYRPMEIISSLVTMVSTLTTLVVMAAVIVAWQGWILPILLLTSVATLWVAARLGAEQVELITRRAETERKEHYYMTLLTSSEAAKEIRLFSLRPWLMRSYRGVLELIFRQDRDFSLRLLRRTGILETALSVIQPLIYSYAAWQALQGLISIGEFSLYTQSVHAFQTTFLPMMYSVGRLHESKLFIDNLHQYLAIEPRVEAARPDSKRYLPAISATPRIEFRAVSFSYPGSDRFVLQDVNFIIEPGEAMALVGENGAGKSTLVKLLAGLYEPNAGQILLDGVDICSLDREHLRRFLSVTFQDYTIYHFSARDNVALGQVEDRQRFEDAVQRSGLDRIVAELPDGFETVLGRFWDRGHELSGGQRQVVALARALMRDAPILMLDEPSAALDIYTERRFFERLLEGRASGKSQTVLFISHRFTTVRRAERILVLENGRVTEQGTHEALLARGGHYAEMFMMQAEMYDSPATISGSFQAHAPGQEAIPIHSSEEITL
jgi:ATP-binding cassette, subfamily B, bacterial